MFTTHRQILGEMSSKCLISGKQKTKSKPTILPDTKTTSGIVNPLFQYRRHHVKIFPCLFYPDDQRAVQVRKDNNSNNNKKFI